MVRVAMCTNTLVMVVTSPAVYDNYRNHNEVDNDEILSLFSDIMDDIRHRENVNKAHVFFDRGIPEKYIEDITYEIVNGCYLPDRIEHIYFHCVGSKDDINKLDEKVCQRFKTRIRRSKIFKRTGRHKLFNKLERFRIDNKSTMVFSFGDKSKKLLIISGTKFGISVSEINAEKDVKFNVRDKSK